MPTETADELKSLKATVKGSITRIKNLVSSKGNTLTLPDLECRLGILESYFKQLLAYQTSYEKASPEDSNNSNVRYEYEELYIGCKSQLLTLIAVKRKDLQLPPSDLNQSVVIKSSAPNLHKVKIPKFTGKYSEYPNFIGIFNKSIHDNDSYEIIEKFNILVNSLDGLAKNAIREFQISEDNYPKVLKHLKDRFDNKTLMFQELISELFELPKVSKLSATSLRNLVDSVNAVFSSMLSIGSADDIANSMIIYVVMTKLDAESQTKWEDSIDFSNLLKWEDCAKVLSKRCQFLECREAKNVSPNLNKPAEQKYKQRSLATRVNSTTQALPHSNRNANATCVFCKTSGHGIYKCSKFSELPVIERYNKAKILSLCLNCLGKGHSIKNCPSDFKCKVCSSPHHSLLHRYSLSSSSSSTESSLLVSNSAELESSQSASFQTSIKELENEDKIILATALVHIRDNTGEFQPIRALLDSGSQINFITENMVNALGLKKSRVHCDINGIGNSTAKARFSTESVIKSRINNFSVDLKMFILPTITGVLPDFKFPVSNLNIPKNVELADPLFFKQKRVDMLIGAEQFFELLSVGQIKLGLELPVLQKTLLGWIVSGRYKVAGVPQHLNHVLCTTSPDISEATVNDLLTNFWKMEGFDEDIPKLSEEQQRCEEWFNSNVLRDSTGRIVVKLPFKRHSSELGNSRSIAEKRFFSLEKKLNSNTELKLQYSEFLSEYLKLGHMELLPTNKENLVRYYLPHHCVFKPDSSTTKIRVVFDGSAKTSNGVSLNDILMVGPTVQDELFSVLLRFRSYKYALKADICKMYRQVLLNEDDSYHQCILWRDRKSDDLQVYRLKTVTYGTASASYLATKSLSHLANQHSTTYCIGSKVISRDFYVDDLLTGGNSLEEITEIRQQVDKILNSAGMELKKWYSNCYSFLEKIPEVDREKVIVLDGANIIKTLGISWQPSSDEFKFTLPANMSKNKKISKRSVLSDLSKLFDPLGFINPVVVKGKILLQQLWLLKLDWDESLPVELHTEWQRFLNELDLLNKISLPRFLFSSRKTIKMEIHGFADASLRAFGACIYMRSIDDAGQTRVNLITAKSKVAPTSTQSIPRLKLCAALLLSNLTKKVSNILNISCNIFLWTDSEIVLDWLAAHASTWTVFVANRVSKIQELTKGYIWRHVNSKANAADLLSRGATVPELLESFWFSGPTFLYESEDFWPPVKQRKQAAKLPEQRSLNRYTFVVQNLENYLYEVIIKCSNYNKILNIFSFICRFIHNCKNRFNRRYNALSPNERNHALLKIIEIIQKKHFHVEISSLAANDFIASKSSIKNLNPFLECEEGVQLLKVGGRLTNADIPYSAKHPILLPKNEPFTNVYIHHLHNTNLHAGPQALLSIIRQRFWVINGRHAATKVVKTCIRCFRFKPKLMEQIMGDLPKHRLQPTRPFFYTGIDFCGPVLISPGLRGKQLYKAYICVFVCFVTHAVHLELVSSLSADAFISCFKRFIGRRGLCHQVYCDNGTNFVGARKKLKELYDAFQSQQVQNSISNWFLQKNVEFHHIPPRSPHFGGLWEAAVKSAKMHLNRCVEDSHLTYEEMSTILSQIEGILNSRPISPMSSDPSDESALTPGHFLIGGPLNALPEKAYPEDTKISSLKRFHRTSLIQQHFWKRWSSEYLQSLQKRHKWQSSSPNLAVGTLVLISEDNLPPQHWALGRIVQLYPGRDNKIRVVDVRSRGKILRRQIHSLAPLIIEN